MSDIREWIVAAVLVAPGRMKLCFYERRKIDEPPGIIACKELELHEIRQILAVGQQVVMDQLENLTP